MGAGKIIKGAVESIGETAALRSPKGLEYLQDNSLLFAIGFAICAVVVIFVLYKIFKKD